MSKKMSIAKKSSPKESEIKSSPKPQSLAISEHSLIRGTPRHIRKWLMSLRAASRVSRSALPGKKNMKRMTGTSGPKPLTAFASYDRSSAYWRTLQISLLTNTSGKFLGTWPKQGMTLAGVCYRLAPLVRHTHVSGCSSWPTPLASEALGGASDKMAQRALNGKKRQSGNLVALKAGDLLKLRYGINKRVTFYEWLMGWVPNWSALEPLAMDKFRLWLQQHGITSQMK